VVLRLVFVPAPLSKKWVVVDLFFRAIFRLFFLPLRLYII
jgi:hypothetical protein